MTKTFFALGTVNKISISYKEADEGKVMQAADLVKQMTESMDDRLSVFKPTSEMSALNANSGRSGVRISPDTMKILLASKEWSEITDGAFDITTQPLTKLWSIGKSSRIPSPHEIRKARKLVGYEDLVIDGAGNGFGTAGLRRKGQSADLELLPKGTLRILHMIFCPDTVYTKRSSTSAAPLSSRAARKALGSRIPERLSARRWAALLHQTLL